MMGGWGLRGVCLRVHAKSCVDRTVTHPAHSDHLSHTHTHVDACTHPSVN